MDCVNSFPISNFNFSSFNNISQFCEFISFRIFDSSDYGNDDKIKDLSDFFKYFYFSFLFMAGICLNLISVLVFTKKNFCKLSTRYYLTALAVSDSCALIKVFVVWNNYVDINRKYSCQVLTYISGLSTFCGVWLVVAYTVDILFAAKDPVQRHTLCGHTKCRLVLAGLFIIGCIMELPILVSVAPQYMEHLNNTFCSVKEEFTVSRNH
jgi:hypothetical protein